MAAVNMQQGYTAVLWVLAVLGMEATALGECELTRLLQDKLQYEMRLQYMKHYFPINYMVQVQYEEVLRPSNITRLRNGTVSEVALRYLWFHVSSQAVLRIHEVLPEKHPSWKYTQELCQLFDALGKEYSKYRQVLQPLQDLPILLLTLKATDNLSLLEVMCEAAEGMVPWLKPRQRTSCLWMDVFQKQYLSLLQPPSDVEAVVADLVKLIHSTGVESRRKAVRPKALLDNCLKVMRMLYGAPCQWEST